MRSRTAPESRLLSVGRSRPSRRPALVGAAALLVFGAGLAAGHLTGGRSETPEQPVATQSSAAPHAMTHVHGPSAPNAGRTPVGAARAAARALSSLADPVLLSSPAARQAAIAALAAPAYRPRLEPLFTRTYDYLSGLLGAAGTRSDVVLRTTPVGYRVEAFSARRATVAIWQVTLLATPARAPIAAWSTSHADLAWFRGRWQVERFGADVPGPVPSVTAPSTAGTPAEFVSAADGFVPFGP